MPRKNQNIKSLEEIFGESIEMDIVGFCQRKIGNSLRRRSCSAGDEYTVRFCEYNCETDSYVCIAFMKLNFMVFEDMEVAYDIADETGAEEEDSCAYALKYIENDYEIMSIADTLMLVICELRNFYVSPKYRNRGVSEAITLTIPDIINELGYVDAVVTTYLNPFLNQTEIKNLAELNENSFGGYSNHLGKADPEIVKNAGKSLKKCGFVDCGDGHFASSTIKIQRIGKKNGYGYSNTIKTTEYE